MIVIKFISKTHNLFRLTYHLIYNLSIIAYVIDFIFQLYPYLQRANEGICDSASKRKTKKDVYKSNPTS